VWLDGGTEGKFTQIENPIIVVVPKNLIENSSNRRRMK